MRAVHIFRRDLRIVDNRALLKAAQMADEVIPVFIFDPRQVEGHDYFASKGLQFLIESLVDLKEQISKVGGQLSILHGTQEGVVSELLQRDDINIISFNRDYTPFSQRRDNAIMKLCEKAGKKCIAEHDLMLTQPDAVFTGQGKPYSVFTPYYRSAQQLSIPLPLGKPSNFAKGAIDGSDVSLLDSLMPEKMELATHGGRTVALELLEEAKKLKEYKELRDIPAKNGTTLLSAHNKFGTISVREFFHAVKHIEPLSRQLYWRDFFTQLSFHNPKVYGNAYQDQFNDVEWSGKKQWLKAWKGSRTGFPIVDAGIKELVTTGYMHNRVRMIVASFLVKDLHIDWREGEKFFAQHLIDYDPAVNNGSWQWAASTGADAAPYFRIFNPWLQQKKFDADCAYIKKWLPSLKDVPASALHKLNEKRHESVPDSYPKPIVDHYEQKDIAKALFVEAKEKYEQNQS